MDILGRLEIFEMEVLDRMNISKLLDPLVFGGGMLRLCQELNRYSVDLDFRFVRKTPQKSYFQNLLKVLSQDYEITDSKIKHFTIRDHSQVHPSPQEDPGRQSPLKILHGFCFINARAGTYLSNLRWN